MTTSSANNSVFRSFFEKQKLTGPNFIDWYRQLRTVLSIEDKLNYLEQPIPPAPVAPTGQHVAPEILAARNAWIKGSKEIDGLMLMTMEPEIQQNQEPLHAHEMIRKQEEGQLVSSYNYNMHIMGKTVNELHAMLKLHEQTLPKNNTPALNVIRAGKVQKGNKHKKSQSQMAARGHNHGKGKNKQAYAPKPKIPSPPKREDPAKDSICHECVFQKEVENQLGKTIKSLHSDREGEYMSQEFLDHLKDHRIIAHRTPPYTSQHNGVSKRRHRTLLDMVQSMISQTTLPKFFWDYTLETAARILNMVLTKKRDTLTKPDKLEPRSIKYIFIGYPKEMMGCSFYYPPKNKVLVARNVEFLENSLINQEASGSLEDLEIIQEEDTHPSIDTSLNHEEDDLEIDEPQSDTVPIRRSTRTRHAMDHMCLYIDAEEHELGDLGEPTNYKAALLDPESKKWLNAMNVEMQFMKENEVWVLVELPPNGKTVGSKWLFKKKTDMDGNVHTYKARLVAKGYTQTIRIDYEETFSSVADISAIRILIPIAAHYDYEIWQMNAKTAFLNGYLNEEVYMEQPEGFVNLKYPKRKFGFTQNIDEPCVYLKASGSNITFLILYVDDILIMENNIPMLQSVKTYLGRCFAMKDLAILHEEFQTWKYPYARKLKLSKSQGASTPAELKRMQNVPYASAVGSIMYAVRCTRPDVAFTHNVTSRFQQNPGDIHWTTVKNILKVSCYIDADDLKSQSGYVFILNGGDVDWNSAKQSIFATSSTKAEYIAAFDAFKEAVWVRKFISGLGVVPTIEEPISMYCNNTRAVAIANESGITKGARHFRTKVHYLHEVIEYGDITLEKVHTDDNLANPFTKALAFPKPSEHTRNIGMLPASSLM
nr:hypothetical protein [Tanacetum cinerariifolium]